MWRIRRRKKNAKKLKNEIFVDLELDENIELIVIDRKQFPPYKLFKLRAKRDAACLLVIKYAEISSELH